MSLKITIEECDSREAPVSSWPLAQISELWDEETCPLCQYLDCLVISRRSKFYQEWRLPSHVNCRRTMVFIHRDEQDARANHHLAFNWKRNPDLRELVERYGHYHTQPECFAEFRIPAEPAGRLFVIRWVKLPGSSEITTALDWAPWWKKWEQAYGREPILQAMNATLPTAEELDQLLGGNGIGKVYDVDEIHWGPVPRPGARQVFQMSSVPRTRLEAVDTPTSSPTALPSTSSATPRNRANNVLDRESLCLSQTSLPPAMKSKRPWWKFWE